MRKFEKNKNLLIIFNLISNSIFQCKKILYEFPIFQIERNTIERNPINNSRFHKCIFFFIKINKELKIEFLF